MSGRLRFRVAALLALALLPIGIVGVLLTRDLAMEVQNSSELTLLALTERKVEHERQVLERAIGAAEALGSVLGMVRDDPDACRRDLRAYLQESGRYSFVGFVPLSGRMTCSTADDPLNLSDIDGFHARILAPRLYVDRIETPPVSGRPIVNLLQPIHNNTVFTGFMSISVPVSSITVNSQRSPGKNPLSVIVFNAEGDVLSRAAMAPGKNVAVPQTLSLRDLAGFGKGVFRDQREDGVESLFVVVPMIPGAVYALAAWPPSAALTRSGSLSTSTAVFPLVMWGVTLLVAFVAIDRLVGRYVRELSGQMRSFARDRRLPRTALTDGAAAELQDLESSFVQMAYALMDDEARMEDALREKNVLLKEVHHRVKNNLQLISSIMNMNMRKARNPETIAVLRQLQERILGLSTVHRNLYQAENLSRTNGGTLLRDLLNQIVVVGAASGTNLSVDMTFEDVILFPDQAVPLAMLATELGTNALKHISAAPGKRPWIRVRFFTGDDGVVRLVFANSNAHPKVHVEDGFSGLGSKLVRAFATQIGAEIESTITGGEYRVDVSFKIHDFAHADPVA